jgi:hypothetical protein
MSKTKRYTLVISTKKPKFPSSHPTAFVGHGIKNSQGKWFKKCGEGIQISKSEMGKKKLPAPS